MGFICLILVPGILIRLSWDELQSAGSLNILVHTDSYNSTLFGILFISSLSVLAFFLIISRYELTGMVTVSRARLTVTCPLRRRVVIDWEEMKSVRTAKLELIDRYELYIVFSKEPVISQRYIEHINDLAISQETIKIVYTRDLYESLISLCTPRIRKSLKYTETELIAFELQNHIPNRKKK